MIIKPKAVLATAVFVALVEVMFALAGTPTKVDRALSSSYQEALVYGCFLAACSISAGIFSYVRPESAWVKVGGFIISLGTLVITVSNYLIFTGTVVPVGFGVVASFFLLAGFLCFFVGVLVSRDT